MNNIVCASIAQEELIIDEDELSRRLKMPSPAENEEVARCIELVRGEIKPRYCYGVSSVAMDDEGCLLDFMKEKSVGLARSLAGCKRAYVVAVTLGLDADRLISRLMLTSKAKAFMADAIASALAEAAMEYINSHIKEKTKERYSIGFGDFVLSNQALLLEYINADKLLGIKLSESFMMIPSKSVTAVIGVME